MRAQIAWFTDSIEDKTGPDLDNITKPFLDELEGRIILDDQLFREVHLRKVEINHRFEPEPPLIIAARTRGLSEFVYVRIEPLERDFPTAPE